MKTSLYIFILLSILLVADCIAYYFYQISLAGYYSDIILLWLWLLMSLVVIVLFWKKILAKVFLGLMVVTLVLSIAPMGLPFYTFILSMTSAGLRLDKDLNDKYRGQIVGYGVMVYPWLEIIEKHGLLERKILECTEMQLEAFGKERIDVKFETQLSPDLKISEAKDLFLKSETDSTIAITIFYGGPNKTITFDKINKSLKYISEK
ncbi:hypothetical protein [Epilithonimonas lactis]|uniref:Uncharacterized protein n=1 Tax=Epilithonimonas lactis TaxID=421072 RepID=A0A085BFR1_9FLAO|nr:hypothetical protein [Epilithonimonas lactis]KFC21306.1 hypothetical protein IO89_14010 [Epilithonimonas lactis]SEP80571.1 hypothetical protein SAMN04488097_0705 [Epilithonimonas lactis]